MAPIDRPASAILQTVVLVLAVLAGTATVVDPVTAAAQDLTITNEGQELTPGRNLTFEVTNDVSVEERPIHVWIDANGNGEFDTDERNLTVEPGGGQTADDTFPDVTLDPGTYTLMADENASLSDGQQPDTTANFTIDDTPPSIAEAVAFTETEGTQAYGDVGSTVVEVLFNESLSDGSGGTAPDQGDFWVRFTDGTINKNVTIEDGGTGDATGDRRVVLFLTIDVDPADVDGVATAPEANFTDDAGNPVPRHPHHVTAATTTVAEGGENTSAFGGEHVAIVGDENDEDIDIRGSDNGTIEDTSTGPSSRVFAWNSKGWSMKQRYFVLFDGRSNPNFLIWDDVSFELDPLGLDVSPSKTVFATTEDLTATVSAKPDNRTVNANLLDNDTSPVASKTVTLSGKDATLNFGQQSEGAYTISVEDEETGLETTSTTIKVTAPSASPTPASTPTSTSTPTLTGTPMTTVTSVPERSPTPTTNPADTPAGTPFAMVTPPENRAATSTPTSPPPPTATQSTGAPPTPTSEQPEGVKEILGLMWEGASDTVHALVDILADTVSGLLP